MQLDFIDRRVLGLFHQFDSVKAIILSDISFARIGDNISAVGGPKSPSPFTCIISVDFKSHV